MSRLTKSWLTTVLGVIGGLGVLAVALTAELDSDPLTLPNWGTAITAALGLMGVGAAARDHNVTSEEAGA